MKINRADSLMLGSAVRMAVTHRRPITMYILLLLSSLTGYPSVTQPVAGENENDGAPHEQDTTAERGGNTKVCFLVYFDLLFNTRQHPHKLHKRNH